MKKIYVLALGLLALALTERCSTSKDSTVTPVSIVGLWSGDWGYVGATPYYPYKMLFRANGTVRVFNGSDTTTAGIAEGTYTVSTTTVKVTYTYLTPPFDKYSTTADFNNASRDRMTGTYGTGTATTGGGVFFLTTKINLVGMWSGAFDLGATPFDLLFRDNGTFRFFYGPSGDTTLISDINKTEGSYTIGSDSVRMKYSWSGSSTPDWSFAGKLNGAVTHMVGTLGAGTSTAGQSDLQMTYY